MVGISDGSSLAAPLVSTRRRQKHKKAGLQFQHQMRLPLKYRGIQLATAYRVDFIVENCLIVEVKCVEKLLPVHKAQLLSYLKLTGLKLGLLLNFNVPHMRNGIGWTINGPESGLKTCSPVVSFVSNQPHRE
jgi:GxxExxY protein